ncbi:hypothetical protein [Rhodanobacter sp. BL-MT-08]
MTVKRARRQNDLTFWKGLAATACMTIFAWAGGTVIDLIKHDAGSTSAIATLQFQVGQLQSRTCK